MRGRARPGIVRFFGLAAWLVLLNLVGGCREPETSSERQERLNVLLIVVDDLRPDLGSYGNPTVQSPNIDRLAARGVRFERAYSQFPVCNPSRASFLTGLRPSTTGVLDNTVHYRDLLPDVVTLPELFRKNGYFTASFGKVFHGGGGRKGWANPQAWDVVSVPRGRRRGRQSARERSAFSNEKTIGWVASKGRDEEQHDGQVALETVTAIEQAGERPFMIAAGFLRPHAPMVAPERYFDLYSLDELRPHLAPGSDLPVRRPLATGEAGLDRIDEPTQLKLLRAYYACISFVDAQIGIIFDAMDRLGLWQDTVVVLLSDHGIHLGERGWWSKNTLSEVSARVPLIVHAPGLTSRGRSSGGLVELIDVYPTLAELAGVPAVPEVDGRSFVPLLGDPDRPWKSGAVTQAVRGRLSGYSVRTERWRYTDWGPAGSELFDHQTDPAELVNVVSAAEHQESIAEFQSMFRELSGGHGGE